MIRQKQIKFQNFIDLTALTASTLDNPEVSYILSENNFYTKVSGVNTEINPHRFIVGTAIAAGAGTSVSSINFGNNSRTYVNVTLAATDSTTTFVFTNAKLGGEYIVNFTNTTDAAMNNIAFSPGAFLDKDGSTLKRINGLRGSAIYRFACLATGILTLISKSQYISRQIQTTHGNAGMADRINHYYYKDTSLQIVGYNLTLPANPDYENELTVYFGNDLNIDATCGSIGFTAPAGHTIVHANEILAANRVNGESLTFKCDTNNIWRLVSRHVPVTTTNSVITYNAGNGAIVKASATGITFTRTTASVWTFSIPAGVTLLSHKIYSTSAQNPGANVTINYNYLSNTVTNQGFTTAEPPSYTAFNMQTGVGTQSATGGSLAANFRPAINSVGSGNITMLCQMGSSVGVLETLIVGNF